MENELKVQETRDVKPYDWTGLEEFEKTFKIAQMFAKSTLIPKAFQGNVANIMIAADMSIRTGVPIMAVMQNLYIVNGNPSWSSQFIITVINNSRRFKTELRFNKSGAGDSLKCFAYATAHDGSEIIGPTITMEMARKEGWVSKNGSKWQSMPEVMIQYRAASFFGRMYCPDLLMGLYAEEEAQTIKPEKEEVVNPFKEAQVIEVTDADTK